MHPGRPGGDQRGKPSGRRREQRRARRPTPAQVPDGDRCEHGERRERPCAEGHPQSGHAGGEHERKGEGAGRSAAEPIAVPDDEAAEREDHRQGGDLLHRAEQLVCVDERGQHGARGRHGRP